jgi:hypothetical protein
MKFYKVKKFKFEDERSVPWKLKLVFSCCEVCGTTEVFMYLSIKKYMPSRVHPSRNNAVIFLFLFVSVLQVNSWNKEVRERTSNLYNYMVVN